MAWHLINVGTPETGDVLLHKEFLLDTPGDIANEPTDQGPIPMGSFAYGPGFDPFWQKDADGNWVEC